MALSELSNIHPDWQAIREGAYLPQSIDAEAFDFWLYVASPLYLEDPSQPPIDISGLTITVRASLLNKPIWQGGYDMANRCWKANRPHIPGGSAWLLRMTGGTPNTRADALKKLHNTCTLVDEQRAAFGEGRTFVGLINKTH